MKIKKDKKEDIKMKCDFCDKPALYDGRTSFGPWAFMCKTHFQINGVGLGLGKGQKLKQEEKEDETKKN